MKFNIQPRSVQIQRTLFFQTFHNLSKEKFFLLLKNTPKEYSERKIWNRNSKSKFIKNSTHYKYVISKDCYFGKENSHLDMFFSVLVWYFVCSNNCLRNFLLFLSENFIFPTGKQRSLPQKFGLSNQKWVIPYHILLHK